MSRQWNVHDLIYLIAWHTDVHTAWNEIEIFSSFMIFPVVFYISRKWRRMTSIFSFQSIITKQLLSSPRRWHTLPYDTLYCPILVSSSECGRGRMIVGFTTICNHYNCALESRPWRCVLDTRLSDNVFLSDLRQFGVFLRVLQIPPTINLKGTIYLKYCWKWH